MGYGQRSWFSEAERTKTVVEMVWGCAETNPIDVFIEVNQLIRTSLYHTFVYVWVSLKLRSVCDLINKLCSIINEIVGVSISILSNFGHLIKYFSYTEKHDFNSINH